MLLAIAIVAIVAVIVTALVMLRKRRQAPDNEAARDREINPDGSGRYHAVSIRSGRGACDAARAQHGERYLSAGAPELPLPGCDAADCKCRFVHHRDRRQGVDRRSPFQKGFGGSATRIEADRRERPERRKNPPSAEPL